MTPNASMRMTGVILLMAFAAMITLVATSPDRFLYDEGSYVNYVALLHQYGFTAEFLNSLTGAAGPLYSFVHLIFEPVTHLRPVRMRFVNVFFLVLVAFGLAAWSKRQGRSDYWVSGCSVLIVPMTWVVAGMALTEMCAILFVTGSLYLQLQGLDALKAGRPVLRLFVLGGVCLGIAVWGRQPYLLLSGVPVVAALLDRRLRIPATIFVVIVLASTIPLFIIWRGLVPPLVPPLYHSIQEFSMIHGLLSLSYTGICFFLLAPRFLRLPAKVLLGIIAVSVAVNAAVRAYAIYPLRSAVDRYLPASVVPVYGNLSASLFLSCGAIFLAASLWMIWENRLDLNA